MKLIGLMLARNEEWVLGLSLRVALRWCDEVVVLDHASTDSTPDIINEVSAENPGRITAIYEPDGVWREMAHRQRLLEAGRARRGSHFAIVDADEVLTGDMLKTVRKGTEILLPAAYMRTRMFAMWRGVGHYRADRSVWSNRQDLALTFRDHKQLCWEATDGYDHHHRHPHRCRAFGAFSGGDGGVMHLQFASWRRLVAKHALYKMVEAIRWPDKPAVVVDNMYSQALDESRLGLDVAPRQWWAPYRDLMGHLHLEHKPWQEAECRLLMQQYGPEKFAGLNLFGVVECPTTTVL